LGRSFLLFPRKQAAFAEDFFGEFVFEAVAKQEAAVGGVAYAEFRDHLFVEAAASEVFAGSRTFWAAEAFLEERYCALVNVEQLPAETGFFGFSGRGVAGFGQRDAELLRYQTDGFGESDVFDLLDEAEDVAGNTATEAMIELARGVDGEGCGLLAVEGAKARIVLRSRLFQLDVVADDADDVRLLFDRVREIAGVRHFGDGSLRKNCRAQSASVEYTEPGIVVEKLWENEVIG